MLLGIILKERKAMLKIIYISGNDFLFELLKYIFTMLK